MPRSPARQCHPAREQPLLQDILNSVIQGTHQRGGASQFQHREPADPARARQFAQRLVHLLQFRLNLLAQAGHRWVFSGTYRQALLSGASPGAPTPKDVYANFEQKGVDRIILFSGDTDMIPAMKLARREGLQVFVVKLDPWPLKHNLIEDSDGVRVLTPKP
jgi:hypothetical protein